MKTHTSMGANILRNSTVPFIQMGARIAENHHEKWDGSGYPRGLKGAAIPVEARITCLIDVFDALMSRRVYKRAWQGGEVLGYLHSESGRLFDPELVDVFFNQFARIREIQARNPDHHPAPELPA